MSKSTKPRCEGRVIDRTSFTPREHQCTRNASIERDGKHYCATHDPIAVAERQKRSKQEYDDEQRELKRAHDDRALGQHVRALVGYEFNNAAIIAYLKRHLPPN